MTQSSQDGTATSDTQETKKQRKKQAKREAKTMLKLEQARQDVQKAQRRVAKAQVQLEASETHLHDVEAKVAQIHASQAEAHSEQQGSETSMSYASNGQQEQGSENNAATDTSTPTNQVTAVPPAGGQADVPVDTPQDQESSSSESETFEVSEDDEVSTN